MLPGAGFAQAFGFGAIIAVIDSKRLADWCFMETMTKTGKILIVDDDKQIRKLLVTLLARNGYAVSEAPDGPEAIKTVEGEKFDLVFLDMRMPLMDGMDVLEKIKAMSPETAVIMITGYGTVESADKALSLGAFYYVTKPFESLQKLLEITEKALEEVQEKKKVFCAAGNNAWSLISLSEISRDLNSSHDTDELINAFIKKAKTLFDCDYIAVLVSKAGADAGGPGVAIIEKRYDFNELELERIKHFLMKKYAAFKEETDVLQAIDFSFRENATADAAPRSFEIMSSVTLPLIYAKNVLGVVSIGSHNIEKYSIETSRLLSTLTNQLASSLNNCLLYEGMQRIAMTDDLTDLNNYRFFKQMMEYEFVRAERYAVPLSCIIMDIDNFKSFNDTYGHQAGDKILSEIASILKNIVRKTDTPARYGGEEFVIICPSTNNGDATNLAERIRKEVASHIFLSDQDSLHITMSFGVATFVSNNGIQDKNQLIKSADRFLYLAKSKGKNRVESDAGNTETISIPNYSLAV
jgi:diguanylate cyclase (GGDEF)-like protein